MHVRYAAMAVTGVNDRSMVLRCVAGDVVSWGVFADAKAAVITRADALCEFLETTRCSYRTRSVSGHHRYEVSFEYGPWSLNPALPFKMVFYVHKCTLAFGHDQSVRPEPLR